MQSVHKACVTLTCNNGQNVDILHLITQNFRIHAVAVFVDAQSQTAANFLPFLRGAVAVFQGTDLEHIRVVPSLTQGRMGEDKTGRLFKGQQALFIFQDQVVSRNIV